MEPQSPEVNQVLEFFQKKEKMLAMLAPSFPIDFDYPEIVGKLKRLGFAFVIEVTAGAEETNRQLLELMKKNPKARFVTSPCPVITRLIKQKYPQLLTYLTTQVFSPMIYTAKIARQKYPDYKLVFVGPCPAKKFEAKEDFPKEEIIVLTFKELAQILAIKNIQDEPGDQLASFDVMETTTRLYPISGGLVQSSGLTQNLTDEEYDVVSGPILVEEALRDFENNPKLKLLDILFCEGGCINCTGIKSSLSLEERRKKVIEFWAKQRF